MVFVERVSKPSHGQDGVLSGNIRVSALLFAIDVVLFASSGHEPALGWFAAENEAGMRL